MKIVKHHLADMPSCYAAAAIQRDGKTLLLLAPDDHGPCYAFDSETFKQEMVCPEPGGTMAMVALPAGSVPVPDRTGLRGNGDFVAIQRFFPGFQAQDAEIVYVQNNAGKWRVKTLFKLPFVHRFDILERGGVRYILCSTLCTTKKSEGDWSSPGGLYAAELPDDLNRSIVLTQIAGGMNRNHGFWHIQNSGFTSALTSCDQGVYEVMPPEERGGDWGVRKLLDKHVSEIALCDIDGDGIEEIAMVEPFHGNHFNIYRQTKNGCILLYQYPGNTEMLHVVWGGKLRGQPVFIGGCREGDLELFLLKWQGGKIVSELIESGAGPSNICVINGKDRDLILTANHEKGEGAVYIVTGT
jgi:hypothetical protein